MSKKLYIQHLLESNVNILKIREFINFFVSTCLFLRVFENVSAYFILINMEIRVKIVCQFFIQYPFFENVLYNKVCLTNKRAPYKKTLFSVFLFFTLSLHFDIDKNDI